MAYIYKITAPEKNTEIRFISLKDYDPNDSYEINGKAIGLLNVDGSKIDIGWVKDVPVSITLNEDKTVGYVNINELYTPIQDGNGILYLDDINSPINVQVNIEEGKYYITI